MIQTLRTFIIGVILVGFIACKEEFHQLPLPGESATSPSSTSAVVPCQVLPIEKNIIGTWHFNDNVRTGTITFDANRNIIDPDSLFANSIDVGGRVTAKFYGFVTRNISPSESRLFLLMRQVAKKGEQGTYYSIEANECNKVRLALGGIKNISFELTR